MSDRVQPHSFTVPILVSQFEELDTILEVMKLKITGITIHYERREVTLLIGTPPREPQMLRDIMLNEALDTLQALADHDTDCVCKAGESCPTCRAAYLAQVYCWARKYIA